MTAVQFPENIRLALQPDGKREVKLLIAQGVLPMPPGILIEALKILMDDTDGEIQTKSKQTITTLPENILINFAGTYNIPETLDFVAGIHFQNEKVIEKIMINSNTSDDTFVKLSSVVPEKLATLMANNQVRLLRNSKIAENLKKNPNILQSDIDRMISFLRMNGIILEGESPELTLTEIENILQLTDDDFPDEYLDDTKDSLPEEKRMSLYRYVQTINTGKKIKLALLGNKEARNLLIKDSNKVVSSAVIKNPKMTDGEVLVICQNRSINDEILRLVCAKPDWVKHYSVQLALACNPKTPFPHALRFTKTLTVNDLRKVSNNKNAPPQIQKIAKDLYNVKRK